MWVSFPQHRAHALSRRQTLNRCATQAPLTWLIYLKKKKEKERKKEKKKEKKKNKTEACISHSQVAGLVDIGHAQRSGLCVRL